MDLDILYQVSSFDICHLDHFREEIQYCFIFIVIEFEHLFH